MKRKIFLIPILVLGLLVLTGCAKQTVEIGKLAKQASEDIDEVRVESRDAKRVSDANILNTIIQIHILNTGEIPTIKDGNENFRSFKLVKNSSDFKALESAIKGSDSSMYVPTDPLDPERCFEFYSDGQNYTIKAYLEQDSKNCTQVKPGYCELEIKSNIDSVLNYSY